MCVCVCLGEEALTFCRGQVEGLGANERARHPALQTHIIIGGEASVKTSYTDICQVFILSLNQLLLLVEGQD